MALLRHHLAQVELSDFQRRGPSTMQVTTIGSGHTQTAAQVAAVEGLLTLRAICDALIARGYRSCTA